VFDEASESFTQVADMSVGRWYGQGPVNSVGDPIVSSGLDENGKFTNKVERFHPATNTWTSLPSTSFGAFPMYAGMVMAPNGTLVYTGTYFGNRNGQTPKVWNWNAGNTAAIPGLLAPDCRDQGLTLRRDNQVAVIGGGCPNSATGYVSMLDLAKSPLAFTNGPYLGYAAQHLCGQVLPDRSYFVSGGSVGNVTARYEARRLGLGATAWQTLTKPTVPRQYHSTCLVTTDGKVVTLGTNYRDGTVESRIETYTPWYAQGQGLVRPGFNYLSAAEAPLGSTVEVGYSYATLRYATLTKVTSNTHSSDPNQLSWAVPTTPLTTSGRATFTLPASGAITPPGYYMLSLLDWRGVPSVSKMIKILPATATPVKASVSVGVGAPAAAPAAACCGGGHCC
jgi:hypothetical protein